jgi:hypothetical protein
MCHATFLVIARTCAVFGSDFRECIVIERRTFAFDQVGTSSGARG